jgi:polysaccharide pyruvyl transferase WcaK-like protein
MRMKSLKKIGIVGWWGGKNAGDEYIKHCLTKVFEKDFKIKFIETPFNPNFWNLLNINRLDFLIIGGGGLFTKTPPHPFDTFNDWSKRLKIPFGFLGVGVQEVSDKYKSIIEEIIGRSAFFVVRDTGSYDLINSCLSSSNIIKAPDLTFIYPYQTQRNEKKDKIGVNLRVWNFDRKRTYDNYNWCQAINKLEGIKKTIPLSFKENLEDNEALECIHGIKNYDFNISIYKDIKIMIGMRLHSLIFAVQNSIPVIGIAYTPKIERFFSELNLKEFCLKLYEYDLLDYTIQEALKRHKEISKKLQQYTSESNTIITKTIKTIKNIIGNGG